MSYQKEKNETQKQNIYKHIEKTYKIENLETEDEIVLYIVLKLLKIRNKIVDKMSGSINYLQLKTILKFEKNIFDVEFAYEMLEFIEHILNKNS